MENKCDVCGSTEGVRCEIMMKGTQVDRVYHMCPEHWIEVYKEVLEDFLEHNEYKVNSYLKVSADRMIVHSQHMEPTAIRILRPFEDELGETNE
jgi:hypothetical protein